MKRLLLCCILFAFSILGTGCAVGQKIDLNHIPDPVSAISDGYSVSVDVYDVRPYVASGKKEQCFIGIYRAGFGNPWDVRTKDKVALSDIIKKDLLHELGQAGFQIAQNAERKIIVNIIDYNFDCYVNCRVWHSISVTVKDPQNQDIAFSEVIEENTVPGSALTGPKSAMETRLPQLYGALIRKLVLGNEKIRGALIKQ